MSDKVVIRIENVSKKYKIGHKAPGEGLRHVLQNAAFQPAKILKNGVRRLQKVQTQNGRERQDLRKQPTDEEFWALRDISLEITQGEVVGIIGRNGAGKSTLLKILSRITDPTAGRIGIKGRVASLLEVGTGFHPELTGRENIFLNGAILGMTRREIFRHFDEIIDFAGIEKFIDTPVKRYSSGMYVRLAFAVAAHLRPEILVIDEILAVGDREFQKKCLGKMQEVATGMGRTIFFVSHQLESVLALCSRVCLLKSGRLEADGEPDAIVQMYQSQDDTSSADAVRLSPDRRPGRGTVRITSFSPEKSSFDPSAHKSFRITLETRDQLEAPFYLALHFIDQHQRQIMILDSHHSGEMLAPGDPVELQIVLGTPWLCPGDYRIHAFLYNSDIIDRWDDACRFNVSSRMPYNSAIFEPVIKGSIVLPEFTLSKRILADSN